MVTSREIMVGTVSRGKTILPYYVGLIAEPFHVSNAYETDMYYYHAFFCEFKQKPRKFSNSKKTLTFFL